MARRAKNNSFASVLQDASSRRDERRRVTAAARIDAKNELCRKSTNGATRTINSAQIMVQQHQPNPTHQRLGLAALVAAFAALIALGIRAERRIDLAEVARETPRPDDVLLASFPKSGSHWARFLILRLLDENLDALTFAEAERRMPDLELGPARQAFNRGPPAVRHRRVFKSHQPWRVGAIGTAEHRPVGGEPVPLKIWTGRSASADCPQWRRIIYMVETRATLCSLQVPDAARRRGNVADADGPKAMRPTGSGMC